MKTKSKRLIMFVLGGGALALLGLWVYSTKEPFGLWSYAMLGLILLVGGLSLHFAFDSYRSEKEGLPAEDELSTRIREKAAAKAFYYSIYMWSLCGMFLVDTGIRAELAIGLGIMGMGLVFLATWFYLSKVGISDENEN